jgi:hypothetical protein
LGTERGIAGKVQAEEGELAVLTINSHSTILGSVRILGDDRKRMLVIVIVGSWFLFFNGDLVFADCY